MQLMKSWKWSDLRFLVMLLACLFSMSISAEQWIYRGLFDRERVIRIETNPDNMAIDGSMRVAQFCSQDSEYICIRTDGFAFYFPKKISSSMKSWSAGGFAYNVSSMRSASYLGVKYDVFVIMQEVQKGSLFYLYSEKGGLLALGGKGVDTSMVYLLESKCGYGASADCNE